MVLVFNTEQKGYGEKHGGHVNVSFPLTGESGKPSKYPTVVVPLHRTHKYKKSVSNSKCLQKIQNYISLGIGK
jgi:hypothetical protein